MGVNALGPECPNCGAWVTRVIYTGMESECTHVIRRRHCQYCDHRFYSAQEIERLAEVKWVPGRKKQTIPEITKVSPLQPRKRAA